MVIFRILAFIIGGIILLFFLITFTITWIYRKIMGDDFNINNK